MESFEKSYLIWNRIDSIRGGMSLNELAEKVGIKYQRIKEQRSSGRIPSADDIYRIAKGLNTTMEYLYAGEEISPISEEARLVDNDLELRTLVKAISRDRTLLSLLSHAIKAGESINIG